MPCDVFTNEKAKNGLNHEKEYSSHRILLVDHKEVTARINTDMLEKFGIKIICANSSEDALKIFKSIQENYFTAIFASLYLPNINGSLFANMIRDIEKSRGYKQSIPIYMLISDTLREKEITVPCEANGNLMNPLRKKQVIQILKSTFKESNVINHKKVLIVDDDLFISAILSKMLETEGLNYIVANSGKEAIEIYKIMSKEISVILLDINLGDTTGYEVAKEIRKYETNRMMQKIPIICISSNSSITHQDLCLKVGINKISMFYIVTKPVKKEVLINTINPFLN